MLIEIGCYLLRTPEQTILIDTGYGPGPIESIGGLEGELMDNLLAQNVQPTRWTPSSSPTCTATTWVGTPSNRKAGSFPHSPTPATSVHQADLDHFRKPEIQAKQSIPFMEPSVERLVSLGLLDTLTEDTDLTPEVRAYTLPATPRAT